MVLKFKRWVRIVYSTPMIISPEIVLNDTDTQRFRKAKGPKGIEAVTTPRCDLLRDREELRLPRTTSCRRS